MTLVNRFGTAYRHAIVAMDGDRSCGDRLASGLEITYPALAIRKGDTFRNLRRFRAVLSGLRPDVLITSNWGTIEWAMANALPIVPHIHMEDGFGPDERDRQLPRRVLLRRLLLRRSLVMLPSRTLVGIATEVWRLDPRRLRHIANGIDLNCFRTGGTRMSWPGSGPVVGTVAGLRAEKNVARLVRAFALLRAEMPARLVIVGDGPERGRLEALARDLGIVSDVHFLGHVAKPAPVYAGFDLFALSSDTEQMPISVLEAMASSLPVAATDVGDIRVMLAAENVPFLAVREDRALVEQLRALLRDTALRQRLGAANRMRAEEHYGEDRMIASHRELIEEARRGRPGVRVQPTTAATAQPSL